MSGMELAFLLSVELVISLSVGLAVRLVEPVIKLA